MKSYISLLAVVFAIVFISCSKNKSTQTGPIQGLWVREDIVTDTINFNAQSLAYFMLSRKYELDASGYRKPVPGEGPYSYELRGDSIRIQWTASSCMCPNTYHFVQTANKIEIGNFIDRNNTVLSFRKIK